MPCCASHPKGPRLYTSQLAKWRQRVNRGATSLDTQRPGPVPQPHNPLADEVARLTRENARLQAKLAQATVIMDIQKKMVTLLGLASAATTDAAS